MDIDAYTGRYKINRAARSLRLDQDAADLLGTNKQVVGPTQINAQSSGGANRLGGCQSRSQRKQWQTDGGEQRTQQHAYIEPFAGSRIPGVIAAPAAG